MKDISATLEWMEGSGTVDMDRLGITRTLHGEYAWHFSGRALTHNSKHAFPIILEICLNLGDDSAPTPF